MHKFINILIYLPYIYRTNRICMDIVSVYIFYLKMFDINSSIFCDVEKISKNMM